MSRNIVVLGAGMVGVSIAWHLVRRGHTVTLVDRREPGRETSFGNAGIIQREAVRPYAFPRDIGTLLRVLPNREVDIRYRPTGMVSAAGPLLQYWLNSGGARYERIVKEWASLIMRCQDAHGPMIEAAGAQELVRKGGWLELYRTQDALDDRIAKAREDRERFGVEYEVLSADQLRAVEPHLSTELIGAIHWTQPWMVSDPGALVLAYARNFEEQGGRVLQASVEDIVQQGSGWRVSTSAGPVEAEQVVVALGPWSSDLLLRLGIKVPLFVKRGYHMHYSAEQGATLNHWVMDAERGFLLEPMRAGIRLTTGAELADLNAPPKYTQLAAAERAARSLFPLGARRDAEPWKGARPCMPDMKPVIGPAPGKNGLWLAFGHGHQGFTLGPATGELLAQMMDGETPAIDMSPFAVDRFSG
ncbi:FAD dependent oxidoreductase [Pseudomonas saudimassiliensis]|uniref:FAD dependent oxidoreductase n=1 Tax=Pseudomonas saudimassiliensis TaxID=1461581 RepID=A0A078MFD7_9PSED|nr:FAD-binding oxidoreductase [Pseudomonas saudimassiliensis]CEA06023.1 FAD dependent oxidoreductase [Pseudomonas saudimassiliensis]CEF27450.1 FAD dependent oxidoreductase [Pseudomonas saudimassiliensis]